jgi:hypothetical protein
MTTRPNILEQFQQDQLEKYMYAKEHAPHPDKDAYVAILEQRAARGQVFNPTEMNPNSGGDQIIGMGPSPNGGVEMLVRKSDGVAVLLMPNMPQVKNTPKGPRMQKTQVPVELPLVRRTAPKQSVQVLHRLWGRPVPTALLLFQGRFNTAAREINIW